MDKFFNNDVLAQGQSEARLMRQYTKREMKTRYQHYDRILQFCRNKDLGKQIFSHFDIYTKREWCFFPKRHPCVEDEESSEGESETETE